MKLPLKRIRLQAIWVLVPLFLYLARPTPRLILAGAVLAAVGGLIRAWASGTILKNNVLATGGPYAHTRNPLYLGTFVVGLGLATAAGSVIVAGVFLTFFLAIYLPTMRVEEQRLETLFGEEFRVYAAQVPRFLPRLTPYRPGRPHATEFRLRRYVTNREWEFAVGLSVAFVALVVKMSWA